MSEEKLGDAPSLAECMRHYGVPSHHVREAERAVAHWLQTWAGLEETAESLLRAIPS